MQNRLADHEQRRAALDPVRSFCVSAPAGSGKTELLIQRFMTLLARVNEPEAVLAITFTRKAAAEMRARVVDALAEAVQDTPLDGEHAELTRTLALRLLEHDDARGWELLANPGRLAIRTIDSFCATLARQLPLLSQSGGSVNTSDHTDAAFREAARGLLGRVSEKSGVGKDLGTLIAAFDGNWDRLEELLVRMLARRDQWLVHLGTGLARTTAEQVLQGSVAALLEDVLGELGDLLAPFRGELETLQEYVLANLEGQRNWSWPGDTGNIDDWLRLTELLLTQKNEWRRRLDKTIGFPPGKGEAADYKVRMLALLGELQEVPGLLPLLEEVRRLPRYDSDDRHWLLLLAVSRLLPVLAAELMLVFQRRGETDHTQVSMAALEALGPDDNPTDLALKLDYQLRHILVDEFQDTATNQHELIRRLSRGWGEHNQANPGDARTLFIVGDAMQSIYAFREANVGLFLRARDEGFNGVPLESLVLKSNFRSDAALVGWVNAAFADAFPHRDRVRSGEIAFSPATAQRPAQEKSPLSAALFEEDEWAECSWIADRVERGLADSHCKSMAVLVRSRSHLVQLIAELKARSIPWQAQDIDPLSNSMVVRDLMTLNRALSNHTDRVAWLGLLRAPWCGLELADLLVVAKAAAERTVAAVVLEESPVPGLSAHGRDALARVAPVLRASAEWRERLASRRWLETTWVALGGAACAETAAQLEDARVFFSVLQAADNRGELLGPETLREEVDRLYAGSGSGQKLQLMTLHKAKGLEFDWVFIPGLQRDPPAEGKELLLWDDCGGEPGRFLFAVNDEAAPDEATLYRYLHEQRKYKREQEATRLLYVGATRAAKRLFLTACLSRDRASGEWKTPSGRSLLSRVWEHFPGIMETPGARPRAGQAAPPDPAQRGLRRITTTPPLTPSAAGDTLSSSPDDSLPASRDRAPRAVGNLVHETLQRLSALNEAELLEITPASLRDWWRARIRAMLPGPEEQGAALARVEEALATVLGDPQGRFILAADREAAASEFALTWLDPDGIAVDLVIDRCYIVDGERWVVDYKSAIPSAGEDIDTFLNREADTYRGQLERYRAAMSDLEGLPVRTALYFTGIPRLHEVFFGD